MNAFDAYVAPATPPGQSGLAVVRLAGRDAIAVADQIFRFGPPAAGKPEVGDAFPERRSLAALSGYQAAYGHLISPSDGSLIDEAVALCFRAPHSYTGEDTVEFSVHGGSEPVRRTLAACLTAGARGAEPGEFTRNAFLNGKIDLAQAEAVMDLIKAETERSADAALNQLSGGLSGKIRKETAVLYSVMAELEMAIEYPEHEDSELDRDSVRQRLAAVYQHLTDLCKGYRCGRILKQGMRLVLTGSPNVGKSSLLNRLGGVERSIVTDVPGTTRDLVDLAVDLDGIPVCLTDTAGLRESDDPVERIGIDKANEALAEADLILWLLSPDNFKVDLPVEEQLAEFFAFCQDELSHLPADKALLLVANKMDRPEFSDFLQLLKQDILPRLPFTSAQLAAHRLLENTGQAGKNNQEMKAPICPLILSAAEGGGISGLTEAILALYRSWGEATQAGVLITTARHYDGIKSAAGLLKQVLAEYTYMPLDIMAQVLAETTRRLADIVGDSVSDHLLDEIFSRFCVGK